MFACKVAVLYCDATKSRYGFHVHKFVNCS